MANGIEDLNTDFLPDSEGIKDIIITKGKDIADTKVLDTIRSLDKTGQLAGIITKDDISEIREGVMTGDTQRVKDALQFNYDKLEALSPGIVMNALGYSNPIEQGLALGNFANDVVQRIASASEMGTKSDFGDNMFSNTLEKGLGVINVPIQIGADIYGRGITGATNKYNNFMNPVYDQFGRIVQTPFQFGRNLFRDQFMDQPIRPKPKPPVPQSFIDRQESLGLSDRDINQIMAGEDPSSVTYQGGGGSDRGGNIVIGGNQNKGGSDRGGPKKKSKGPPTTSSPNRFKGPDLRFRANGGLVAVSRYLKGR